MTALHHPIGAVARRTGLSVHVIRIWEQRYGAVAPARSGTKRRLYSPEEVERLSLLGRLTRAGHSIGTVASLPFEQLARLVGEIPADRWSDPAEACASGTASEFLPGCLAAVRALDGPRLKAELQRAAPRLGTMGLLQTLVAPLAQALGELWRRGEITAAHEHCASAALRGFLDQTTAALGGAERAPVLVVATPAGQLHELGALLAAATAANLGWRVLYLGASLPAAELAGAAAQNHARAVALSIVYPEDDPRLPDELAALSQLLPPNVPLVIGGRATAAYREAIERVGALSVSDLPDLGRTLDGLRNPVVRQHAGSATAEPPARPTQSYNRSP